MVSKLESDVMVGLNSPARIVLRPLGCLTIVNQLLAPLSDHGICNRPYKEHYLPCVNKAIGIAKARVLQKNMVSCLAQCITGFR